MINILKKFINKDDVFCLFKNNGSDVVNIIEKGNLLLISIKEECSFDSFIKKLKKVDKNFDYNLIPLRMFLTDGSDLLDCKLKKQFIWFEITSDNTWIVTKGNNDIKISLKEYYDEYIDEIVLEIENGKYKIVKYIHDYKLSTKFIKWYPEVNSDVSRYFSLEKEEAMYYVRNLLKKLYDNKILSNEFVDEIYVRLDIEKDLFIKEKKL